MPNYTAADISNFLAENSTFCEMFSYFTSSKGLHLKPIESIIFSLIFNLTIKQEKECYLSINQFVELTGTTKPTVTNAIGFLEQKQLIYIKRGFVECGRPKNWYSINLDTLGDFMFNGKKSLHSKESLQTQKINTTPPQKSYKDSKETLPSQERIFTKDSKETLPSQERIFTKDSKETLPYNIIDNYNIKIKNNNNDNHSEKGDFVASSDKSDSVLDDKFSAAVYEIKKVYPRKIDEYDSEVLANTLKHIMNAYSLEDLTTAAANYATAMKNELPIWLLQASNFYGKNKDGKRPFTDYLKK